MKIRDICSIPQSTAFIVTSPLITPEIVSRYAEACGFASMAHIKGQPSIFSIKMGLDHGVACLCGAATLCLLNAALEHVFVFDEPYDVISYGYDDIVFPAPNVEGGAVEFVFTVTSTEPSLFPLKPLKTSLPMSRITFQCTGTNTRTRKQVIRLMWHLAYIATSEISSV